jgi:multimeric flavodoxin WrbA
MGENMKYLIINGSPRKKNTWAMVKRAKTILEDGEFEEIQLMKEKIPMCNGCFKCILEGEEYCPHHDQINHIIEKIRESDGLIITSPVYAMNIPALLKNFFDHTAYFYHRPEFFDKKALVFVSTAGAGHKDVAKYIDETLRHWGFNKVYKVGIRCGGNEHLETKEIDKVSKEFKKDIESNKLHNPKFMDIVFYNVWRALALSKDPMRKDAEYWKETGLVNYEFAPAVKLNPLKKIFGKIMFFVLRRVMK